MSALKQTLHYVHTRYLQCLDAEDAECLFTARRDNYVARTFSHMARARLDHAVSRSADLEQLGSEKWEMRYFPLIHLWAQYVPASRMSEGRKYIEQH